MSVLNLHLCFCSDFSGFNLALLSLAFNQSSGCVLSLFLDNLLLEVLASSSQVKPPKDNSSGYRNGGTSITQVQLSLITNAAMRRLWRILL